MKLPWKRQPRDLVGDQVQEVHKRPLTPEEMDRLKWAGMVLIPEEMDFPMVAANGWCAPSDYTYIEQALIDQANAARRGGQPTGVLPMMLSVPEATIRCGGVVPPPTHVYDRATLAQLPAPTPWPAPEPIFKDATAP